MMDKTSETNESACISLFERSTLHEWEACVPAEELSKDANWSSLRPNVTTFWRLFGAKTLPEEFLLFIEHSLRWKVAYSTVHRSAALQMDGYLEIWRDYCSIHVAKCRILDDDHPQWCKLQWSASGNLLFSARSAAAVDAFDANGGFCFTIPISSSDQGFNPLYSVASIFSTAHTSDTTWSDNVWILQYDGTLRYYLTGRVSGYHPMTTLDVTGGLPRVAFTAALLPRVNGVIIALSCHGTPSPSACQSVADQGLSLWRYVDSEPYLVEFSLGSNKLEVEKGTSKKKSWLFQQAQEYVTQIVISSDGDTAACLTSQGQVVAFRVPSLQVMKRWSVGDELSRLTRDRGNVNVVNGIGWWSQTELMLLYSTGFVGTVNFNCDGTTSAVDKNYSTWTQLICAAQGHVLLLEMAGCPETAVVPKRSVSSFLWPLIRVPYVLLKMAAQAFVGAPMTNTEAVAGDLDIVQCRYVMHEMKAITPRELFKKKLIASNYEEALAVAQTYCLNPDRAYQEQWRRNAISIESIDNFLMKVSSRSWVIEECLLRLPDSSEACRKLLDTGIQLTHDLSALSDEKIIELKKQECNSRYRLICYRRILDDYEAMLAADGGRSSKFDAKYYGSVRNMSLYEWALKLARAGEFSRLDTLFSRYGHRLFSIWLLLLQNMPETVNIEEYEWMLPKCDEVPQWAKGKRESGMDFIEEERFANFVESKQDDVDIVVGGQSSLREFLLSDPTDIDRVNVLVAKWYEHRAIDIERRTCLADLAEKFLLTTAAAGIQSLDNLREDMGLLRVLNYESSLPTPVSYERLKKMQPLDIMKLLLKEASKETFLKRFEQWAVPFCLRCEQRNEAVAKSLVWQYVVGASEASLKIPLLLFESFNSKSDWWSDVVGLAPADVVGMASDCLSACTDDNQLNASFQLLSYLPNPADDESISDSVKSLEDHLTALHLLDMYGIKLSYKKLHTIASNDKEAVMLLKRLVRHGTSISTAPKSHRPDRSTSRAWNTNDWRALMKDMLQLSRTVLPSIGEQRCHELFVDGLLSSKSMDLINLASKFLVTSRDASKSPKQPAAESGQPRLSYDAAAALIHQAAESYINEAIDARDEALIFARKCLTLLENPPDELVQDAEFIEALSLLESFGIHDVPGRLKLYKNRTRLLEEIFKIKPSAYEEYEKLEKLCKFLRIPIVDENDTKNLVTYCARQALKQKDGSACAKFCKQIIDSDCSSSWDVCWDACMELCTTAYFTSDVRRKFLTFCLMHCDAGRIEETLNSLKGLKIEVEQFGEKKRK